MRLECELPLRPQRTPGLLSPPVGPRNQHLSIRVRKMRQHLHCGPLRHELRTVRGFRHRRVPASLQRARWRLHLLLELRHPDRSADLQHAGKLRRPGGHDPARLQRQPGLRLQPRPRLCVLSRRRSWPPPAKIGGVRFRPGRMPAKIRLGGVRLGCRLLRYRRREPTGVPALRQLHNHPRLPVDSHHPTPPRRFVPASARALRQSSKIAAPRQSSRRSQISATIAPGCAP